MSSRRTVPNLLEVQDLRTYVYRRHSAVQAVDGVSFVVNQGETVGLVGESGCGKTMTAMSIIRLLPQGGRIVSGTVRLAGRELTSLQEGEMRQVRGNDISVIFQDPMTSLNPTMTIGSQVAEHVRIHKGASKAAARSRALEVLNLVGMPKPVERLDEFPHQLSGGLRQRAMIAIALACEPKLLIADEPTTALDVTIQAQVLELLDDLKTKINMAMLLITHDMGVIAGRADRVMVMYAGRIVEAASTVELFATTRHPYTEALLESIPQIDQDRTQRLYTIPGLPPDLANPMPGCRFAPRCAYATSECFESDPPLLETVPEHSYACFHPVTSSGRIVAGNGVTRHDPEANRVGHAIEHEAPLLVLDHVVKEFPVTRGIMQRKVGSVKAVSDVSFSVNRGETFGLVGESGCGKTTIARMIVALERPNDGLIRFDGEDLTTLRQTRLRRMRRHLQLMFQDPYASLDPRMRVGPALREPMVIQRLGARKYQLARVSELLREVGLDPAASQLYPHEFSGGQRQRIGLARALTLSPKLIVADEPVSALDVSIRSQILNLMRRLQETHSLTYIVISHDLSVIRYLADRVGVMYLGKLVEIGPTAQVYERPAHPYTAGLLAAVPTANPTSARRKARLGVRGELPSALAPPAGCRFHTRCPRAQQICAEIEPDLRAFASYRHLAACHFPLETPLNEPEEVREAGTGHANSVTSENRAN
jgi:peptide/nickel transport system ATP-binding protein